MGHARGQEADGAREWKPRGVGSQVRKRNPTGLRKENKIRQISKTVRMLDVSFLLSVKDRRTVSGRLKRKMN